MMATPAVNPVTIPVVATVATDGLLLLHTPPETGAAQISKAESAAQIAGKPDKEPGTGFTVTGQLAEQPVGK